MDIAAGKPEKDAPPSLSVIDEGLPSLGISEASDTVDLVVSEPDPEPEAFFAEVEAEVEVAVSPAMSKPVAAKAVAAKPALVAAMMPDPEPEPTIAEDEAEALPDVGADIAAPVTVEVAHVETDKPAPEQGGFRRHLPMAIVSLAAVASVISAVGTVVASRTVARTNAVLEQVEAHQSKMRRLDTLIEEVDGLRQREQIALVRIEQVASGKPATSAEVRSAIAGLQMAMAKNQPGGNNGMMAMLRDGQAELAERISIIYRRVERMDEKLGKLPVSSIPKVRHAGDPAPTS